MTAGRRARRVRGRVAALLGCWFIVSCVATHGAGAPAAPSPAAPPLEAAPATGDAMPPAFAAAAPAGDAMPPALAAGDASGSDAVATTPPAAAFAGSCFSWVHLAEFSTDCFRSRAECASERKQTALGHRLTSPCKAASRASCTLVGDEAHERCFGDKGNCGRFRVMLAGQGVQSTDCVER